MILESLACSAYRTKITHKERLQSDEPCIYIANHTSLLDAVILAKHLPKEVVFVANVKNAKKFNWAIKGKNVIKIDPMNPYAFRSMLKVLHEGKSLMIFPEGRITVTNSLMKIYSGVVSLAIKTGIKIIPLAINGAEKAKKFTYLESKINTQWFPETSLYVGNSFTLNDVEGATMTEKKEMGKHIIYRKLQELLLESRTQQNVHLGELLRQRVNESPNQIIAEEADAEINLKKLWRKITGLSLLFENKILQNRVGVLLPTSIANIATVFALLCSGKTPAMLNFSMDIATINSCVETGDLKTIVTSRLFVEKGKLEDMIQSFETNMIDIVYLEDIVKEINLAMKAKILIKEKQVVKAYPADILLFTSGSEGVPKGVLLTHGNITANIEQTKLMLDFTNKDKILNALPMFHSFGLVLAFLAMTASVPTFLVPSPLLFKDTPEIAYSRKATILVGTSTFLSAYARNANPYDFFFMRYVICGAEKLQGQVRSLWAEKFGIRILEGYGLTETSPILSVQTPLLYKSGTVGCLFPGVEYQLEKVEGVEDGAKLKIKAPNLMKGYLLKDKGFVKCPEWFDTGDIVSIDKEGYVQIKGRAKLFVKIGGEMISLPMVEEHVKVALGIDDAIAIGISDDRKGERIEIVTTSSGAVMATLREYWKEKNIVSLALPTNIHVVSEIPLLGSGKVDRVGIKKLIENKSVSQAS